MTIRIALTASLFAFLVAGCASTEMERGRRYVDESDVERPPVVLVYDFAVTDAEVVVDEAGLGSSDKDGEEGAALADEQRKFAREVADVMAATIVAELNDREIAARRAEPSEVPPLHALLLKGAFQTIDEGDQLSRVTVGFGAGKSEVEIEMTLFQQTTYGAKLLSRGDAEAAGSRMPGMLGPVAVGASLGRAATSAVVSGTMTGLRELKGPLGADVKRIAEEFADRAEEFYERRGWL
ncbi:MAG: DUF4410 domain-containing protein [bacterium]|nr:DUF4410 domain-containing protein [bacterium]